MTKTKSRNLHQNIIDYFEAAGLDYGAWSPSFNMHFGYFRWGMNPFNREGLLNQMNKEVMQRLALSEKDALVLDLGCGLGTTSRYLSHHYPKASFYGLTITPWQVKFGTDLNKQKTLEQQITLLEADFAAAPLADQCADAAFAIESACYAEGVDKAPFIREVYRMLKPGGRFVFTDGFRKHSRPLPGWLNRVYRKNMECWALKDLANIHLFVKQLQRQGFKDIVLEDASWKVAPSFAHIPFVSARFLWQQWRSGIQLSRERKNNVWAPLLGMLMGLSRRHFGYYIISGRK